MKVKSLLLSYLLVFSFVSPVMAEITVAKDDPAYTLASVSVTELPVYNFEYKVPPKAPTPNPAPTPSNPINEISIIIDSMIALGKKLWPIIDAGRPVITDRLAPSVSIIPRTDLAQAVLYEMENWSAPAVKRYRVAYKNKLGSDVVAFTYTVYFQFNGSWNNVGKYVTSLKVEASEIYTSWGFNLDATSEMINISNVGTKEAPIGSGIIQVSYKVKGYLNEVRSAQSFFVDGEGNIQLLNN
jgi:hypothetical protein